jgi:hypothetical protein
MREGESELGKELVFDYLRLSHMIGDGSLLLTRVGERAKEKERVIKIDTIGQEYCLPCADTLEVEGVIVERDGECLGCERKRI